MSQSTEQASGKVRLVVELPSRSADDLAAIKNILELNQTEATRRALAIASRILTAVEEGKEIALIDPKTKLVEKVIIV
jgi:hypothetical protein